ncbi:MAG: hypothetical protein AAF383_21415 [Cyanobacteria bacterium P01_A01_bin.83]
MLKNLFGSGKKYYLELDESEQPNVVEAASKAAETIKEKATELAESKPVQQAVETVSEVSTTVKTATQEKLSEVLPGEGDENKPAEAKTAKKPEKAPAKAEQNGKAVAAKEKTPKAQSTPQNSGASSFEPPFWVAAMYNNKGTNNSNGKVAEETFATDNLMPIVTKYRRRPGGSLSKFKDMAKKAKTPRG